MPHPRGEHIEKSSLFQATPPKRGFVRHKSPSLSRVYIHGRSRVCTRFFLSKIEEAPGSWRLRTIALVKNRL